MRKNSGGRNSTIAGQELENLLRKEVKLEGRMVSAREAMLLGLYNRSLNGDIDASIELQRIRKSCRSEDTARGGYLVVPEPLPLADWERLAAEQQARYREKNYGDDPC